VQVPGASDIEHFIGQVYDCTLDRDEWSSLLASCARLVGGETALIYVKPRGETSGRLLTSLGFDPAYKLMRYLSYYEARSPLLSRYRNKPEGRLVALGDYAFSTEYQETEYFRDWIRPQGFADMIGGHLVRTPQLSAWMSIRRPRGRGLYSAREIRMANRFGHHLGRTIKLRAKLEIERALANSMQQSLEMLGFGVLIVDAAAKVLIGNRAADAILRAGEGLKSHQGRLVCDRLQETAALHAAIGSVAQVHKAGNDPGTDICVRRDLADRPLTVHVLPMRAVSNGFANSAVAAVFVIDPLVASPSIEGVVTTYGLTAAERVVLREILQCGGVIDAARKLRLTPATVRTHLRHVFEKTGTNSQAGLVRLVMSSPLQGCAPDRG
jgi:DNA-binding CsgD family transcriptional regulator